MRTLTALVLFLTLSSGTTHSCSSPSVEKFRYLKSFSEYTCKYCIHFLMLIWFEVGYTLPRRANTEGAVTPELFGLLWSGERSRAAAL